MYVIVPSSVPFAVPLYVAVLASPVPNLICNVGALLAFTAPWLAVPYISLSNVTTKVIVCPTLYVPELGAVTAMLDTDVAVLSNIYFPNIWYVVPSIVFTVPFVVDTLSKLSDILLTNRYLSPVISVPIINGVPLVYDVHCPSFSAVSLLDK